jgi:CHRD domain
VSTRRLIASAAALPVVLAAGVWTGLGGAGLGAESAAPAGFTARLNGAQEVPKPKGVKASAQGTFTATLARNGVGGTLSWKLTFQGLSGKATASHIHLGARGRAGGVKVSLCGPCRTGMRGFARVDAKTISALIAGTAYVNVHTAKNAAGEIRGQISKTAKPPQLPAPTTTNATTTGTTTAEPDPYP